MATRIWKILLLSLLLLGSGLSAGDVTSARLPPPPQVAVDAALWQQAATADTVSYVIVFREQAELAPAYELEWAERGRFVVAALQEVAQRSQVGVRAYLDKLAVSYRAFWVDNVIVVEHAPVKTLEALQKFPQVAALRTRVQPTLIEPRIVTPAPQGLAALEPNIAHVNADDVWARGYTGEGIVMAHIDTGARFTHEALQEQYRGAQPGGTFVHDYHWWDPYDGITAPDDPHGHGSHTMGIMVGGTGDTHTGMAPGASWIACQGFKPDATDEGLLECGQFMLAPWDLNEQNPNPDLRPHIVNNSWGDCQQSYSPWYEDTLKAWQAAGIYPVFSNGNAGNCNYTYPPGLNTVGNPARSGFVTAVGSTGNSNGAYAAHSNWGPTDNPDLINPRGYPNLKPQVVAPGVAIRSAYYSGDASYAQLSGTSMSAPHVAGLVALMWDAAPCLIGDYAATETLLEQTATPIPYATGNGDEGPGDVPNHATGWGEIDALAAVYGAQAYCGDSALAGRVTDAASQLPLEDVEIQVLLAGDIFRAGRTDASGTYTMPLPADTYTVTFSKYGYRTWTRANLTLTSHQTTTLNATLTLLPTYPVSGRVYDAQSGSPLYASVSIANAPFDDIWTDPATGVYSVSLVTERPYTLTARAHLPGYENTTLSLPPLTGVTQADLGLQPGGVCMAPGYTLGSVELVADFEDGSGGYTTTTGSDWQWGTPTVWPYGCSSGEKCWGTNLSGNYSDSAAFALTSPELDLTGYPAGAHLLLSWQQAWAMEWNYDYAYAEVSINGGPWQEMWSSYSDQSPVTWMEMRYDVSEAAGGVLRLRWRYTSDGAINASGYYVDDVKLWLGCQRAPGSLVVGNVRDQQDAPLVGIAVIHDGGAETLSAVTPEDPDLDDGFYTLFAPAGERVFTATGRYGLSPAVASRTVPDGATLQQDFTLLPAPRYTVTGQVRDAWTGWPIFAHLATDRGDSAWTNPATGNYRMVLYGDYPYVFTVTGRSGAYLTRTVLTQPLQGPTERDFTLTPQEECSLPEYEPGESLQFSDFEGDFPPPGWQRFRTGAPDDPGWLLYDAQSRSGNYSAYHDDEDTDGMAVSWLVLPRTTLPGVGAYLSLWQYQVYPSWQEYHGVWLSTGSADPLQGQYVEVASLAPVRSGDWEPLSVNLTPYAGQEVYIALRYHGDYADEWYVDDVELREACQPLPGGLLTGYVSDAQNGEPLVGARVTLSGTAATAVTGPAVVTPEEAGYYRLFAPPGVYTLTATHLHYETRSLTVTVADGESTLLNLALEPLQLAVTLQAHPPRWLRVGNVFSYTLLVTNQYTQPLAVQLINPLPGVLAYQPGSAQGGLTLSPTSTQAVTLTWSGELPPTASQHFTYSVRLQALPPKRLLTNQVTLYAGEHRYGMEASLPIPYLYCIPVVVVEDPLR